ncbi:MAG TPA: helix-turn-helix transcriptional regulator [Tepidisphaeraceae bacterium]|nr:helix-turn-helix transcriptional regulator [Tepidisphaeraceae bacterium]
MRIRLPLEPGRWGMLSVFCHHTCRLRAWHSHEEPELNLVLSGSGYYLVDGRRLPLARNTLVWLFPAQEHVLVSDSPDFSMWVMYVRPKVLRWACTTASTAPLLRSRPGRTLIRTLPAAAVRQLDRMLRDLEQPNGVDTATWNAGLLHAMLLAWELHNAPPQPEETGRPLHPAVHRTLQRLWTHGGQWTTDQLAAAERMSRPALSRLFKGQTGITIVDYRRRQGLERFAELYADGRARTVEQAAAEAGFGSYAQFYRVVRQRTGLTPTRLARQIRDASWSERTRGDHGTPA